MQALISTGRIVDVALLAMALEACVILAWRVRTGGGIAPLPMLVNFAAGGGLLLALRAALTAENWEWIAIPLAAALAAHLGDLLLRWKNGA